MGCTTSNEWYKQELIKISDKSEQEIKYMIEQIIISSSFNERDIYFLYLKFLRLDPLDGLISNSQLLELPEFKYCPFKKHLIRVFKLSKDNDDLPKKTDQEEIHKDQNLELVESVKDDESVQNRMFNINQPSINDVESNNVQNIKKLNIQEVTLHQPHTNNNSKF
jgi:hypothetical protein